MANIRIDLNHAPLDGQTITFKAPCSASDIKGLIVYYPNENLETVSSEFTLNDANGGDIGLVDNIFSEGAIVKVILDTDTNNAYVQNPDTNTYIEGKFEELKVYADTVASGKADAEHLHDDKYYTKSETDLKFASIVVPDANEQIDAHNTNGEAHSDIRALIDAKSDFSGSYNDLTDKPTIPSVDGLATIDYVDGQISTHNHDDAISNAMFVHNEDENAHTDIRTILAAVKEDVDTFFNNADLTDSAKDTLKEIQDYIDSDATAAAEMTASINSKADKEHKHDIDDITNLQDSLNNKANQVALDALQEELDSHTHTISDVANLQSELDGKAESSHGVHVEYSTTKPVMDGNASVGSANTVARSDHKHPTDTSRASQVALDQLTDAVVLRDGSNTMTGNLVMGKSTPIIRMRDTTESSELTLFNANDRAYMQIVNDYESDQNRRQLQLLDSDIATIDKSLVLSDIVDGKATGYHVYHTGNKPTLADIGGSNENLLDNWYFIDPVNSRGATEYTAAGYCIDRWYRTGSTGSSVSLTSNGLKIDNTNGGATMYFRQSLKSTPVGKYTLSIMVSEYSTLDSSKNIYLYNSNSSGNALSGVSIKSAGLWYSVYTATEENVLVRVQFTIPVGCSITIKALKLEFDNVQTLGVKNSAGEWTLNDPVPDKNLELIKCYTNTIDSNDDYANNEIYHTGNKPTAADVGALSTSGGTVDGNISTKGINVKNVSNGYGTIYKNNSSTADYGTLVKDIDASNNETTLIAQAKNQQLQVSFTKDGATKTYKIFNARDNIALDNSDPIVYPTTASSATRLRIYSGRNAEYAGGAGLILTNKDATTNPGNFSLVAHDGTNSAALNGLANGTLTWKNNVIYHAGNKPTAADVGADPSGKVTITDTTPSSATTYYPLYATGTSGSQTVRANTDLYYYDEGASGYLNVGNGATQHKGGLTLHDASTYYTTLSPATLTANRSITLPNASGTVYTTGNKPTLAELGAAKGSRASITLPATAGWYRIATSASSISNCMGLFMIRGAVSGAHGSVLLSAGISYGNAASASVQVLHCSNWSTVGLTKARIVYNTSYSGKYAYLEVYNSQAKALVLTINAGLQEGWTLLTESTAGAVPDGYVSEEITFANGRIIADGFTVNGTTASTSTSTGALIVKGGVGVAGNLYAAKVYGAVWNDYAEYREANTTEPGRVVCEYGDDTLRMATERLQPGASVVSDTFGFAIGETDKAKTPIAVSGRVLVYTFEDRNTYSPGDAVCAAPNGTVSKMSREEIINYPERIVGTVSAVPSYETWGEANVPVNGRIWIKVK